MYFFFQNFTCFCVFTNAHFFSHTYFLARTFESMPLGVACIRILSKGSSHLIHDNNGLLFQDTHLVLQVLTNIENYLVEEERRMIEKDKKCKFEFSSKRE